MVDFPGCDKFRRRGSGTYKTDDGLISFVSPTIFDEKSARRNALSFFVTKSRPMQFVQNNWPLILVMLVSGGMLVWPFVQKRLGPVREVGVMQATQLINRQNAVMLDVRETKDCQGGRVPNALHIPLSELAKRGSELGKYAGRPVIAYCDRGNQSRTAASALAKMGFADVHTLRGGVRAWSEAGLPLRKDG
jgi:rhodanese-related sulfurtransferase